MTSGSHQSIGVVEVGRWRTSVDTPDGPRIDARTPTANVLRSPFSTASTSGQVFLEPRLTKKHSNARTSSAPSLMSVNSRLLLCPSPEASSDVPARCFATRSLRRGRKPASRS